MLMRTKNDDVNEKKWCHRRQRIMSYQRIVLEYNLVIKNIIVTHITQKILRIEDVSKRIRKRYTKITE